MAHYNSLGESVKHEDVRKSGPLHKIATLPFHDAWATPAIHDNRTGLRINGDCQVMDMNGQVIPMSYYGGRPTGGFSEHGLDRDLPEVYREAARSAG